MGAPDNKWNLIKYITLYCTCSIFVQQTKMDLENKDNAPFTDLPL